MKIEPGLIMKLAMDGLIGDAVVERPVEDRERILGGSAPQVRLLNEGEAVTGLDVLSAKHGFG